LKTFSLPVSRSPYLFPGKGLSIDILQLMRYYFTLQFRMLNRNLTDFGLHPVVGYALIVVTYAALSEYLFFKTEYAIHIYCFAALSIVLNLSNTSRNAFLKSCFNSKDYYLVRIIENTLVVLPFIVFLLFRLWLLPATILYITAVSLVIFNFSNNLSFTIPTPFYKKPFEFIVGFRNTFYLLFFAYFLAIMSVLSGNFNLGIFSLLVVAFICLTFYTTPEGDFYVWIFTLSPAKFLLHKIKTAMLFCTILCLPVLMALCLFYPTYIGVVLVFQGLSFLYLLTVILARYSAYPNKMNLPQVLLIAFSVSFPPLLLGVIPYFYIQSTRKLNEILS